MRFRLSTIAYVFALFATAMATLDGWGILVAGGVLASWLVIWNSDEFGLFQLLIITSIVGTLLGLLLPPPHTGRESSRSARCHNNIELIAGAIWSYASQNGAFPRAIERDEQGAAKHSWRTSILPLLEQRALFERYQRDEPYNSPNNAAVAATWLDIYQCPSDPPVNWPSSQGNYFAVVGDKTAWPEDRGLRPEQITDGREQTILLIEAADMNAGWAEPRDLSFDEAVALLTGKNSSGVVHLRRESPGFFYRGHGEAVPGVHVAFANRRIAFLPTPISRELATALLTAHVGDEVDAEELSLLTEPMLDYGKIISFAAFVALALAPGVRRVIRNGKRFAGAPAAR